MLLKKLGEKFRVAMHGESKNENCFLSLNTSVILNFVAVISAKKHYYSRHDFPSDFIFGSSTSAYQVLHLLLFR